jgi:demethylmenaquinone methyltransferase / 2-methoxy-6-polyprenyl-1,4-benzoquinol methylase
MANEYTDDPLTRFRAQNLDEAMADASRKQGVVTPMFDVIAPRYDAFTRLFSFGMDSAWKRRLIAHTVRHAPRATTGFDVACGTGDLAFALAAQLPLLRMTGVDPSSEMLALATARAPEMPGQRVTFHLSGMATLPAGNATADVITAGYGFRNVPDLEAAVRECARVLRPGGVLGSLDFFLPPNRLWRSLFLGYLGIAGNIVGWLWHRTPAIYGYIARSINSFVTADEFSAMLVRHGFQIVTQQHMLMGGIALHIAIRRDDA